jgi:hypothetical protein
VTGSSSTIDAKGERKDLPRRHRVHGEDNTELEFRFLILSILKISLHGHSEFRHLAPSRMHDRCEGEYAGEKRG